MAEPMTEPRNRRGVDERTHDDRSARLALLVFAVMMAAALVLFLVYGHSEWFWRDEWAFLADRKATDLGDLLRPHNEHWSTLPILVYRMLWQVFGLRTYVPYQLIVILLHLTAAGLLRVVMRRAGVGPWIATAAASLFVLFGAGHDNVIRAFQMGFVGALVLGLTHLLLADHDGPSDRRDWLGILAGSAGLLCSGVAVTMIVVVGLAMLVRRGWRVAALHTVPLGVCFAVWWVAFARDAYTTFDSSPGQAARFVTTGVGATFDAMGQIPGVGLALGALLMIGLLLAWRDLTWAELRRRAAAPGALLVGSAVFLVICALGRASILGPSFARSSRYLHLVAAMLLPALAVAADAVARRWRPLVPVFCALLVLSIPGNVAALSDWTHERADALRQYRHLVLAIPRSKVADEVPRELRPDDKGHDPTRSITVGWLRDAAESGRLPKTYRITAIDEAVIRFRMALIQSNIQSPSASDCEVLTKAVAQHLDKGDTITFYGGQLRVTPMPGSVPVQVQSLFAAADGERLTAVLEPLDVVVQSGNLYFPARLCSQDRSTSITATNGTATTARRAAHGRPAPTIKATTTAAQESGRSRQQAGPRKRESG